MDVFRFTNPNSTMRMEQGRIINGLKSKLWVERYAEAGECTFVAEARTGIRDLLPIGSFVSHTNSTEIMIIEDHQISDSPDNVALVTITGRGLETFFEQRVVGSNRDFPRVGEAREIVLVADYLANQIVALIQTHILPPFLMDVNDALPYVYVATDIAGAGESVERSIKEGYLYERMLELLAVQKLGVKIQRPGPWAYNWAGNTTDTRVLIHQGVDRTKQIIFSEDTGEIESADYLFSNKPEKNAALIVGKWIETKLVLTENQYDRRWVLIDARDVDDWYETAPTSDPDYTIVVDKLIRRGYEVLSAQNQVAITRAEVSKNTNNRRYRTDFDVGDLITVSGAFSAITTKRISEYVEIEDENGETSYPTLVDI